MEDVKAQISDIVQNMQFERRKPVTAKKKAALKVLKQRLAQPIDTLNRLRLLLWHTEDKNSYRAVDEANLRERLTEARDDIDAILKELQ